MKKIFQIYSIFQITLVLLVVSGTTINCFAEESINKSEWEKISNGKSYVETYKERNWNISSSGTFSPSKVNPSAVRIWIWLLVFMLLLVIIYVVVRKILLYHRPKEKQRLIVTYDSVEDHFKDADLEVLLNKALSEQLYFVALRIQYLIVLKSLDEKKLIEWRKNKTNGHYLAELFGHNCYNEFLQLTYVFEKIWYGEVVITQLDYTQLSVPYKLFNEKINNREPE